MCGVLLSASLFAFAAHRKLKKDPHSTRQRFVTLQPGHKLAQNTNPDAPAGQRTSCRSGGSALLPQGVQSRSLFALGQRQHPAPRCRHRPASPAAPQAPAPGRARGRCRARHAPARPACQRARGPGRSRSPRPVPARATCSARIADAGAPAPAGPPPPKPCLGCNPGMTGRAAPPCWRCRRRWRRARWLRLRLAAPGRSRVPRPPTASAPASAARWASACACFSACWLLAMRAAPASCEACDSPMSAALFSAWISTAGSAM